ncbi:unnamed protein product [Chrysoparadoxa australica]
MVGGIPCRRRGDYCCRHPGQMMTNYDPETEVELWEAENIRWRGCDNCYLGSRQGLGLGLPYSATVEEMEAGLTHQLWSMSKRIDHLARPKYRSRALASPAEMEIITTACGMAQELAFSAERDALLRADEEKLKRVQLEAKAARKEDERRRRKAALRRAKYKEEAAAVAAAGTRRQGKLRIRSSHASSCSYDAFSSCSSSSSVQQKEAGKGLGPGSGLSSFASIAQVMEMEGSPPIDGGEKNKDNAVAAAAAVGAGSVSSASTAIGNREPCMTTDDLQSNSHIPCSTAAMAPAPTSLAGAGADDSELRALLEEKELQITMLKQQLSGLGEQPIEEVATLDVAKSKLTESLTKLMAGDDGDAVQKEFDKWDRFVRNHPEHLAEEAAKAEAWREDNESTNKEALRFLKTYVPPNIFASTLDQLKEAGLTPDLAKRIWEKKALWLVRAASSQINKMHIVEIKSKYQTTGLDLTEMRAVYAAIPDVFDNDASGDKEGWKQTMLTRVQEMAGQLERGTLKADDIRHRAYGKETPQDGPFDPDAVAVEQEMVASSAFAATEKPVVGQMSTDKIGVIKDQLTPQKLPPPVKKARAITAPSTPLYNRAGQGKPPTMKDLLAEMAKKGLVEPNESCKTDSEAEEEEKKADQCTSSTSDPKGEEPEKDLVKKPSSRGMTKLISALKPSPREALANAIQAKANQSRASNSSPSNPAEERAGALTDQVASEAAPPPPPLPPPAPPVPSTPAPATPQASPPASPMQALMAAIKAKAGNTSNQETKEVAPQEVVEEQPSSPAAKPQRETPERNRLPPKPLGSKGGVSMADMMAEMMAKRQAKESMAKTA